MRLKSAIQEEMNCLTDGSDKSRLLARASQVQERYKQTIQRVYRANAQMFLDHTNSVYIIDKDGCKTLIVYMDESIYAAELNAQRELIRLHMHQMFDEDIQVFDIHVSRGSYKKKYPYKDSQPAENTNAETCDECTETLSAEKESFIDQTLSAVDDPRLRSVLKKAMTADLKRCKEKK